MMQIFLFFFFNDTATTEIYTLSLPDALPIYPPHPGRHLEHGHLFHEVRRLRRGRQPLRRARQRQHRRSEEHTSELQSRQYLVCRLLLEKKNKPKQQAIIAIL